MLRRTSITALVLGLFSLPAIAQDNAATPDFGGDRFQSGANVIVTQSGIDDLFATGSTVRVQSDVGGSAYLAGRKLDIDGAVAGDVFSLGIDLALTGPISGDATVAGSNVTVNAVGGDLRASGGTLTISGPVAGYAMLAGDETYLGNSITGDLYLAARRLDVSENAQVDGRVIVFEEDIGTLTIPASLAAADRIERRELSDWDDTVPAIPRTTWQSVLGSYLIGALIITALAALVAAVIPERLARLRRGLLSQPLRNVWFGFLAESVAVGSAVIFGMTLIGIMLIPASLFIAFTVGFAGYVVAAYSVGVGVLMMIGQPEPDNAGARIIAAGTGGLVVGAIALIPFFGWLFVLALVLAGVGAITLMAFQPVFFAAKADPSAA